MRHPVTCISAVAISCLIYYFVGESTINSAKVPTTTTTITTTTATTKPKTTSTTTTTGTTSGGGNIYHSSHDPDIIVQNPIIKVDSTEAFHNSSYALYFSLMNIITFFKSVCHVTGKMFIEKLLKNSIIWGE